MLTFRVCAPFVREKRVLMKLQTRCFPPGALPYDTEASVVAMMAKLYEKSPFLPFLPNIEPENNIIKRTLSNIPGVVFENGKMLLRMSTTEAKQGLQKLDKAFNKPEPKLLEPYFIDAFFMEKYLQIIKKFKSPQAYVSLLGPFSVSQILMKVAKEQMLTDKSFRKLFIQAVCVKALWAINKIQEYSPMTTPVIILEELYLGKLGTLKRENEDITVELVTNMLQRVVETIKSAGAICAVQCMEKCDWKVPINAGADVISLDAYNNPNNLNIIPEAVTDFLAHGGKINWAIVPVMTEALVKGLNIDYVLKRLNTTLDGLILAGVPDYLVYNSALVSIQGNVDKLPLIFAEKALILSTQLAKRLPTLTRRAPDCQ